jgi:hypothetical protein
MGTNRTIAVPKTPDDDRQGQDRGSDADEGRAPLARHADGQHDRERLHELHDGGEERRHRGDECVHRFSVGRQPLLRYRE